MTDVFKAEVRITRRLDGTAHVVSYGFEMDGHKFQSGFVADVSIGAIKAIAYGDLLLEAVRNMVSDMDFMAKAAAVAKRIDGEDQ